MFFNSKEYHNYSLYSVNSFYQFIIPISDDHNEDKYLNNFDY